MIGTDRARLLLRLLALSRGRESGDDEGETTHEGFRSRIRTSPKIIFIGQQKTKIPGRAAKRRLRKSLNQKGLAAFAAAMVKNK